MKWILRSLGALSLVAVFFLATPQHVSAFLPIGGKVVGMFPCIHGGGWTITVVGFGIGSGVFWYSPATVTFLYGPPFIGEWVLGMSDVPTLCGERATFVGTSLTGI